MSVSLDWRTWRQIICRRSAFLPIVQFFDTTGGVRKQSERKHFDDRKEMYQLRFRKKILSKMTRFSKQVRGSGRKQSKGLFIGNMQKNMM